MADRTVHATTAAGGEIVRYDRSGKWYYEHSGRRVHIELAEAVTWALQTGATVRLGLPGGVRFDAAVRRLRAHDG